MVSVVLRILNTCVLDFCVVSVWSVIILFMVIKMWIYPGVIFECCTSFLIFQ